MDMTAAKQFEISGRDETDLVLRLDAFRQAVRIRGGGVLDVKWTSGPPPSRVTIFYHVPVVA